MSTPKCRFYDETEEKPVCDFFPGGKTDDGPSLLPDEEMHAMGLIETREADSRANACGGRAEHCFWLKHKLSVPGLEESE